MRFRLRTLLFFVTVCGGAISCCVAIARQHAVEMAAVDQLRHISQSGKVLAEDRSFEGFWAATLIPDIRSIAPRWLDARLRPWGCVCFDRVVHLTLGGREFDDHIIEYLTTFTSLKKLELNGTSVSARGLRRLAEALPNADVEYIDWRDVEVRSPVQGHFLFVAAEGTAMKPGDLLATIEVETPVRQLQLRATQDGKVRYQHAEQIGEGAKIRERQIVVIIQPFDSRTMDLRRTATTERVQ